MPDLSLLLEPEAPDDAEAIERLNERVFGPGRFARTAYRIRETADPDPSLSFVAGSSPRLGIQVDDHLSCRISRRNWGLQSTAYRLDLTLPFDLLARTSPGAKRRSVAMFLAP